MCVCGYTFIYLYLSIYLFVYLSIFVYLLFIHSYTCIQIHTYKKKHMHSVLYLQHSTTILCVRLCESLFKLRAVAEPSDPSVWLGVDQLQSKSSKVVLKVFTRTRPKLPTGYLENCPSEKVTIGSCWIMLDCWTCPVTMENARIGDLLTIYQMYSNVMI